MKQLLQEDIQVQLKSKGLISETELAYQQGKVFIAVDTVTGISRIIDLPQSLISEGSNKRVLRG